MSDLGTCLVTGADGFIGSHLVEALVARGHKVRALCHYNAFGHAGWLDSLAEATREQVEIVPGDVRDAHAMIELVHGIDTVFHLAALIAIPYSYRAPDSYVETNVRGTLNMLEAARAAKVKRFVHTSTSEVYGTAQRVPIDETHPLNGQSPYAASKIGADQMAMAFHASFGTPVAVIRPFNTYGPRQSARAVIPTIITQIAAGRREIRLGATAPTRDFSFVADTVAGFLAVASSARAIGEVIQTGSGFEISIGETAALIAERMGAEIEIVSEAARQRPGASEVERLIADTAKAERLLGWRPEFGGREGFVRGLERTIAWFRDPANLARYRPGTYQI